MQGLQPRANSLVWVLVIAGLAAAGGLTGCDEETGLVVPVGDVPELPLTPDAVVDSFAFALARQDSQAIETLLSAEFEYHTCDNADLAGLEVLERDRFARAMANFCRSDSLSSCQPTAIDAHFTVGEPWTLGTDGFFPNHGVLRTEVAVSLTVQTGPGCPEFDVDGDIEVYVEPYDLVAAGDTVVVYRLQGLRDHTPACGDRDTWTCFTKLVCSFLPAGLPRAQMVADRIEGTTIDHFRLDASASDCSGLGLHAKPYRWRIGDSPVWTLWSEKPDLQVSFATSGRHPVVLEVRNTVGWISQAEIEFDVYATQPASFEELLGTIAYAHRIQDEWLIGSVLDGNFEFVFAPSDVETYDLPLASLSFPYMMRAVSRLFSDDQPYQGPPEVTSIRFQWDAEPTDWPDGTGQPAAPSGARRLDETHVVYIEAVREEAETLRVGGPVYVTAAPGLMVTEDGSSRPLWRLTRVRDKSNERPGGDDQTVSWGRLLALYCFTSD